jgi:hypothetical protein
MKKISALAHLIFFTTFFLLIVGKFNVFSQYYPNSFYTIDKIDSNQNNSLIFRIDNSNFLKNNEYTNNIYTGYTLIGYHVSPQLVYYPTKSVKLEMGVHFLKYSGIEQYTKVLPLFSAHWQAGKNTEIILGTLKGSINHRLIDPIFDNEKFYTENVENGLQFLFDTRFYKGDIWINWQNFIFKGGNDQEIFTMGFSNRFFINSPNAKHSFSVPLQTIFVHHGGQINETSLPVTTHHNSGLGINYTYHKENSFLKSISLESMFLVFNDLSTTHVLPYISGYGCYSQAQVKAGMFDLSVAHWFGDFYISDRGNQMYQSLSTVYEGYKEPQRGLVTSRAYFEKKLIKGLHVGTGFETYSDLYHYTFEYGYFFYINFNSEFFIKSFKEK